MENLKKTVGLVVMLAFPLLAITAVMAQGEGNRQDSENISEAGQANRNVAEPLRATDVKIHKKIPISALEKAYMDDQTKGKPSKPDKPGKKKNAMAATGVLGDAGTGEKYAIIIGICDYPGSTSLDLCQSDGDSLHMYKALTTLYGYNPDNIYLFKDMGEDSEYGNTYFEENSTDAIPTITAKKPTYNNILSAIDEIKNLATSSEDEVVFFFSGHGAIGNADDSDDENIDEAIVVWKTEENAAYNIDYIWDGELRSWFSGFATTRIAFVFDTCRAGGMNDIASEGRVISMATEETRSAYVYSRAGEDVDGDGQLDGEGVFSRLFVNLGMLQGYADVFDHDNDTNTEDVVVEEAFDYAKKNIPRSLKGRQKPVISDNFTDDLLLGYTLTP